MVHDLQYYVEWISENVLLFVVGKHASVPTSPRLSCMRGVEGVLEPISSLETLKKSGLLAISATIERGHFSQEHVARERLSATGFVLITAAVANDLVYGSAE